MKKFIVWLMCFFTTCYAAAQAQVSPALSLQQVFNIVNSYHPVAAQANNIVLQNKAELLAVRGAFDPVIKNDNARKTFDGVTYYDYNRPALVIPTWFGIEVSAGLEYLGGSRTNPEESTGKGSYLGISIPLAKNLLMDKRRAALQTAKIYRDASETEKRSIMNDLLVDVANTYWEWALQYQVLAIANNAVLVNQQRLQFVKTGQIIGERPAIDTIEALTQLQTFLLLQSQAELSLQNAALQLSSFLWTENSEPYYLPEKIIPADGLADIKPENDVLPNLAALLDSARTLHPDLAIYDYKLRALHINKLLKFQELLPKIDLKYNQLGNSYNLAKTAITPLLENNFQYGISVSIPLRFSTGRGEYKLAKLKINNANLQRSQKSVDVENKVRIYFNQLLGLRQQVALQDKAHENFKALQRGEEIRFQNGESSLFLINTRENKTLEALQKLQELKTKYLKTRSALRWATGTLAIN